MTAGQVPCPPHLRRRHKPSKFGWCPPGYGTSSPHRLAGAQVGQWFAAIEYSLCCDPATGLLWLEAVNMARDYTEPGAELIVERVADGFEVLAWPEGRRIEEKVPSVSDAPARVVSFREGPPPDDWDTVEIVVGG